jgi:hypothetical protein
MSKRSRILRDPKAGPGMLMVEGQQYPFSLEGVWKSEVPPTTGMIVDVYFDTTAQIEEIYAVSDSQLAKEQADATLAAAKEKGAALVAGMVARFGLPTLIASVLLIISWFFLTSLSIKSPFGSIDFTFWQVLGYLNAGNAFEVLTRGGRGAPSTGLYGFAAIVAIAGPFVSYFWKDRRAVLAGSLPLILMVFVFIAVRSSITDALSGGGAVPENMREFAEQTRAEAMKAISIGFGAYLSVLASLHLAAMNAKKFLATKVTANEYGKTHKPAA